MNVVCNSATKFIISRWRGTRIPRGDIPSRRNFPEFQMGLRLMWLVISSAHNLTVIQTVRRKLHTTLNNICTVLTSIRDVNVSTVPTRFSISRLLVDPTLNSISESVPFEPHLEPFHDEARLETLS
jgi:hypothetical protein